MKLNDSSKNNTIKKKNNRKLNKKKLKSVDVASNELASTFDKTDSNNEIYKPSLKPLKSRVNNHKIKSIKVNESSSTTKNVTFEQNKVDSLKLEKIIEYDEDLMQLNDDKIVEQLENDDLIVDEIDLEKDKIDETREEEENLSEFVDELKSIEMNENEIHLVPKPKEEYFKIDNLNKSTNKDESLIDNKMFYKELFRIIEKGKNLEKISKSKAHFNYLDNLKSGNSLNENDLDKRNEKVLNDELIKIDKITNLNNFENQLDQDNLTNKNIKSLSDQLNLTKIKDQIINFVEKMDDSNQLIENQIKLDQSIKITDQINQIDSNELNSNAINLNQQNLIDNSNQLNNSIEIDQMEDSNQNNQIDQMINSNQINNQIDQMENSNQINNQVDHSNQMDDLDHNENTTFNKINVAILTGLLSVFFYYYNNFT